MKTKISSLINNIQHSGGGHIFYCFNTEGSYVDNAVSFIGACLSQGSEIIFIENERIYPIIQSRLKAQLAGSLLKKVHFIDNFEFYCMRGDFHTTTIIDYFSSLLKLFDNHGSPVRTWAHVEWGDEKEIEAKVSHFETASDKKVSGAELISVCAYDSANLSPSLKKTLMETHPYYMMDSDIILSEPYIKTKNL